MKKTVQQKTAKSEIRVTGIPASAGIAIGDAFLYSVPTFAPELRVISQKRVPRELSRFQDAIKKSQEYLKIVHDETEKTYGHEFADLIHTQLAILEDKIFLAEVEQLIKEKHFDAAYATFKVFKNKKEHFLKLSDEYFRDRASDIQNLKQLVLKHILGGKLEFKFKNNSIIAADDLSPADTIKLHHQNLMGICTNFGGKNSHTAIIARSLGVPAVVGTEVITSVIRPGEKIILDGNEGLIILNPSEETIKEYQQRQTQFAFKQDALFKHATEPAITNDGQRIQVQANIEFVEELEMIKKSGAEGIGLYRTEGFFFNGGGNIPSEDSQAETYLKIAEAMYPHKVITRTLDVGGDKIIPEIASIPEHNPFLGWRAIRFCLDHPEIFIPQLKAILRANIHQNMHLLIPMVSGLEEIRQFRDVLKLAKKSLDEEGLSYNPELQIGMMVEIPAAVLMADQFAKEVDFFSIGTNDLIQYTLAVDRANEKIAHLYNHFHPAVLRLIKQIIDVGNSANIDVNMCGEMAGDPVAVPLLIGMGLRKFSVVHKAIPEIKNVIRNLSMDQAQALYQRVIQIATAKEIQNECESFYKKLYLEVKENQIQ